MQQKNYFRNKADANAVGDSVKSITNISHHRSDSRPGPTTQKAQPQDDVDGVGETEEEIHSETLENENSTTQQINIFDNDGNANAIKKNVDNIYNESYYDASHVSQQPATELINQGTTSESATANRGQRLSQNPDTETMMVAPEVGFPLQPQGNLTFRQQVLRIVSLWTHSLIDYMFAFLSNRFK